MCSAHLHYALTKPPQQQKYLFIETSFSSGTSHVVLRKKHSLSPVKGLNELPATLYMWISLVNLCIKIMTGITGTEQTWSGDLDNT